MVELLAIIAIISLLAALLLPVLRNTKRTVESAKCVSNLKQIVACALLYADDNDNSCLRVLWTEPSQTVAPTYPAARWMDALYTNYLGGTIEVLECPAQKFKRDAAYQMNPPRTYMPGYLINRQVMSGDSSRALKLSEFKDPAKKVLFADAAWDGFTGETYAAISCLAEVFETVGYEPVSKRHHGGSNLAFVDGHIEWMSYAEVMPIASVSEPSYRTHWDPDGDGNSSTPD